MKFVIGMLALIPMYVMLLITSLIARSMAVVSVTLAAGIISIVFWTKSSKLIDWATTKLGTVE